MSAARRRGRRAIVVGAEGQDGRILCESLRRDGWAVIALDARSCRAWNARPPRRPIDLSDRRAVAGLVARFRPDEVYYLAAHHHAAEDRRPDPVEELHLSLAPQILGPLHFLEAIRTRRPRARFFYAASCRVFGHPRERQDESTPVDPDDVYGITKAAGLFLCRMYRRRWGVFASAGILYNHESPLRHPRYVSRRIVDGLIDVRDGRRAALVLGDLRARCDWGYAPEFVDAMRRILALPRPDDFVIATGRSHTVLEFARLAARALGLKWRRSVREDRRLVPEPSPAWEADPSKLRRATGWRATTDLESLTRLMIESRRAVAGQRANQLKGRSR